MPIHLRPLLLAAVLCVFATSAFASAHKQVPDDLNFFEAALFSLSWEVEHFIAHLSMTYQALVLCFTSPSLGLALLQDQMLCASVTPLTGLLFSSAFTSVFTLLSTMFVGVLLMLLTLRFLAQLSMGALPKPALRIG